MRPASSYTPPQPTLPTSLSLPLRILPDYIHNKVLITMLNRIFRDELQSGELDFLYGKSIRITIVDAGIDYHLTIQDNFLISSDSSARPDLALQGTVYNYMLLASRQEDTDTLFFSRHLQMQGDTELGLYVKNFLDGLDMDSRQFSAHLTSMLKQSLPVYERMFSKK